jgi:AraC-like DNA-binding protein
MHPTFKGRHIFSIYNLHCWRGRPVVYHDWHCHNEVELNHVESGAITYLLAGNEVTLKPGDISLFWGMTPHWLTKFYPNTTYDWISLPLPLFLQWELPRAFVGSIVSGKVFRVSEDQFPYGAPGRLFQMWLEEYRSTSNFLKSTSILEMEACLKRLAAISQNRDSASTKRETTPHGYTRVADIALFVSQHYKNPLPVSDVAKAVGVHPHYAMDIFRKYCGMSIVECVSHHRVAHAQRLLVTTDAKMIDIAYDSGFGSLSHFYAVFKKFCGEAPKIFRARHFEQ